MEKLAYQLWKKDDDSLKTFKEALFNNLSKDIAKFVSALQINIADADVEPANNLAQSNYHPAPNAVIFIKVKSYFLADTLESHLAKITNKGKFTIRPKYTAKNLEAITFGQNYKQWKIQISAKIYSKNFGSNNFWPKLQAMANSHFGQNIQQKNWKQ